MWGAGVGGIFECFWQLSIPAFRKMTESEIQRRLRMGKFFIVVMYGELLVNDFE